MKLISNIISGFISSPFVIGWLAIMAILFNTVYDKVVSPMAALYGHNLPDPPFWQWIVFGMILSFVQFLLYPTRKNDLNQEEMAALAGKRIGLGTCFFALAYLINWIWL